MREAALAMLKYTRMLGTKGPTLGAKLLRERVYILDMLPKTISRVYISGVLLCERVYDSDILPKKTLKDLHFRHFTR